MFRQNHPACGTRAGDRGAQGQARSRSSWAFALPPHAATTSQCKSFVALDTRWAGGVPRRTDERCPATAVPGSRLRAGAEGARRAPLRGDASHEAKGRRGARGGGADRVRAPAGRLRLLRQIGDQLVPGLEEFLFVDDVVAVEDGAGLVTGQEHGDALGDAGADQVAGGGAAAIVEEAGRYAGRLAGGAPRRAPAADGDAVAVEDQRAIRVAARPPSVQGVVARIVTGPARYPPTGSSPTDAI